MCELLGMSFSVPVRPNISFRGFRHRGSKNLSGWGIAFYPDRSVQVMKEKMPAEKSGLSKFLRDYSNMRSETFIGHVRLGSRESHKNSHPFSRELGGRDYIFAHNGTLTNYNSLDTGRFKPVGDTDSEHAFCHILNWIEEQGTGNWDDKQFKKLSEKLMGINEKGTFNCIISNGEYLFCYYDKNGYKGLCFVQRSPPYGENIRLKDEDWQIDLSLKKSSDQEGFVIATNRLTDEEWHNFEFGELIVFRRGKIVFSSVGREPDRLVSSISNSEIKILKILRQKPHRTSVSVIQSELEVSMDVLKPALRRLICRALVVQDSRDPPRTEWDDDEATYYTSRTKRDEIDGMIGEYDS